MKNYAIPIYIHVEAETPEEALKEGYRVAQDEIDSYNAYPGQPEEIDDQF